MCRPFVRGIFIVLIACGFVSCPAPLKLNANELLQAGKKHDVRILRDTWGVPHIFGATDADVAFGLAYAHAEDDFATIQETFLADRALVSSVKGREFAPLDYLTHLFRIRELVDAKYEQDLSPEVRAICDAYAEGINLYAALHPQEVVKNDLFPGTGKDVVVGFVQKVPLFFGLDHQLMPLLTSDRKPAVSTKTASGPLDGFFTNGCELGSNAFAVAGSRAADGKTRLAVNSHQPWSGPVAWYEAHLHSNEGMDITGGTFPGAPIILHGHNRNLGWAHTVNLPDLADIYELEMNPGNPNQYKFDGQWRDLEVSKTQLTVRVFGPFRWTFEREVLGSVYGPAIRRPQGVYAIRYAGYGDIRQVEQWYRMGKAHNFDEWQQAMRTRAIPSFNAAYADREGNIFYLYNALLPMRAAGYDWKKCLPGNTSETLWTEYLPFEKLPQVKNPASGFVITCNNSPFQATIGPENAKPEDYAPSFGIETIMTNRAIRALELFGGTEPISEEKFLANKYDLAYSKKGMAGELLQKIFDAPAPDDPVAREAVEILRKWDMRTNVENTGAAIAILTLEPVVRAMFFGGTPPDLMSMLQQRAHLLKNVYGRVDVPWGEVNRMRRGAVDLPLSGGPDVLRAIYGSLDGNSAKLIANNGDSYILIASWDKEGKVSSQSIHQFGSATSHAESPHYADQAPLFAACKLKPAWLDEAEIRAHLEREYRPGEETVTPASKRP